MEICVKFLLNFTVFVVISKREFSKIVTAIISFQNKYISYDFFSGAVVKTSVYQRFSFARGLSVSELDLSLWFPTPIKIYLNSTLLIYIFRTYLYYFYL